VPEIILYNGKIHTQNPDCPQASAIAIRDGKVFAIGGDQEIRTLASETTRQIDLAGRCVIPGLTDSHMHVYEWALLQRGLDLDKTGALGDVLSMVQASAAQKQPGEWIIGQGWNQETWPDEKLPSRYDLDQVAPENPTILWRTDMHLAWVNSAGLKAASITSGTDAPPMGVIDRDVEGTPTGILRELAINLVREVLPPATENEIDEAIQKAIANLHKLGLTGAHDFRIMGGGGGPSALRAWHRLRARNKLNLRIWALIPGEQLEHAVALGLQTGFGDDMLRIGPAKYFSDGSTGARTAWMLEPFADGGSGMPLTPMGELAGAIALAHQHGIATATHAIGDRAIRELLDVHTEILGSQSEGIKPVIPHRIEHVQHGHPTDLSRMAGLGLVASVQPIHATDDYQMIDKACGERAKWAYAFRDLLDAGTVLAFGSDCPVASPNPFWGIHAAVTRQRRDGSPEGGWYPAQRLSVEEAVWGYTMGAAIASGQQERQGSLSPGKFADLVVLDRDIFEIEPTKIHATKPVMTMVDGGIVYTSQEV